MSGGLNGWIDTLFADPAMTGMGHAQREADGNLGLGWIYYGMARLLRPQLVVVIGSYRGFAPLVFARALADNAAAGGEAGDEAGRVILIEPSLVDDFWASPQRVTGHFAAHGITNIDHLHLTTQEWVQSPQWSALGEVGIALVDGFHSEEQARIDHQALAPKLAGDGYLLFHDSLRERVSRIYGEGRAYTHTVTRYIDTLRGDPAWQVLDIASGDGLSIVREAR